MEGGVQHQRNPKSVKWKVHWKRPEGCKCSLLWHENGVAQLKPAGRQGIAVVSMEPNWGADSILSCILSHSLQPVQVWSPPQFLVLNINAYLRTILPLPKLLVMLFCYEFWITLLLWVSFAFILSKLTRNQSWSLLLHYALWQQLQGWRHSSTCCSQQHGNFL